MNVDHLVYRVRMLPEQLARARARVAALEVEARELRMFDLLSENQPPVSDCRPQSECAADAIPQAARRATTDIAMEGC